MLKPIRLIFVTIIFLYSIQVQAMGFLDFMRVYIFSEVDGVVLMKGKPVSGAKVVRTADYKNEIHTNEVITDEQGRFHFDDIYTYSMRLSETVISQKISIMYEDEKYQAWRLIKRHENRYGELTDPEKPDFPIKKLNLICELTDDQEKKQRIKFELGDRIIYGLCHWD